MSKWRECKLGEISVYINRGISPSYVEDCGIPIINQKCIRKGAISNDFLKYHSKDKKHTKEKQLKKGDILINSTGVGTAGRVGIFSSESYFLADSHITILRVDEKLVIPEFVFYNLRKREDEIESYAEGSTGQIELGREKIKEIPILLPSLPEQKAIAAVLSSLDDKIDLLHRQNLTLETMAETLFRQWFVISDKTGWNEYLISDFADHIKINVVPSKNTDTIFYHYSLPAYDLGQKPTVELGTQILSNKYKVIENSILVSKLNPRFPRIWAIGDLHNQTAICSTEFQVLKPKNNNLFGFLYFLLHSNDVKEELTMASSGTSGSHQRVKPEDIFNITALLPSVSKAEEFSNQILPNIKKIEANRIQIHTLETLRDNLLPNLMGGEVRVTY